MKRVGLCSHYSKIGDWAFDYAFLLSRTQNLHLNIFHWLESPFRIRRDIVYTNESKTKTIQVNEILLIKKEKELREYYDEKLADFVEVGFRLCVGNEDVELRRCLHRNEFDVLIMGYLERGVIFGEKTIEDFANHFSSPIVLVGPNRADSFYLNEKASRMAGDLMLPEGRWQQIPE